jgi:Calcineurin-like phosphoesterase
MPDPERLLPTLRRAAQCFRDTPGRRGRFVQLQGATEVLVAGDLHGNLDNFRRLLNRAALVARPTRHLVLQELVHGPYQYPAGGDKSHQLLDLTAALKCQFPRQVHYLLGNHELSQWTGRRVCKGDSDLNAEFRKGITAAYGPRAEEVHALYEELFRVVPLALRTANRVYLSHSLPPESRLLTWDPAALERDEPVDGDLLPGGAVHSLVWGRDLRAETAAAFLRKVDADLLVTGHVPCEQGFDVPNDRQLVLDSLGSPAAYCLFPADRPLKHDELLACVNLL